MNRRDLIIISIIFLWGGFWIFFAETICENMASNEILALIYVTMFLMLVCMVTVTILSAVIKPFGKWGDKKLIDKRKIAHRRWQRRWNRALNISYQKAGGYNEDINSCDPMFYFWNELDGLKKKKKKK
jgi:hypothetical protein